MSGLQIYYFLLVLSVTRPISGKIVKDPSKHSEGVHLGGGVLTQIST